MGRRTGARAGPRPERHASFDRLSRHRRQDQRLFRPQVRGLATLGAAREPTPLEQKATRRAINATTLATSSRVSRRTGRNRTITTAPLRPSAPRSRCARRRRNPSTVRTASRRDRASDARPDEVVGVAAHDERDPNQSAPPRADARRAHGRRDARVRFLRRRDFGALRIGVRAYR
jgi:hypothetical protein